MGGRCGVRVGAPDAVSGGPLGPEPSGPQLALPHVELRVAGDGRFRLLGYQRPPLQRDRRRPGHGAVLCHGHRRLRRFARTQQHRRPLPAPFHRAQCPLDGGDVGGRRCGALLAVGYLALIPIVSPKLDFVLHDPAMAVGVVLLGGVFGPLNLITDSIFIGLRQARYNAIVDGGIGGPVKIVARCSQRGRGRTACSLPRPSATPPPLSRAWSCSSRSTGSVPPFGVSVTCSVH